MAATATQNPPARGVIAWLHPSRTDFSATALEYVSDLAVGHFAAKLALKAMARRVGYGFTCSAPLPYLMASVRLNEHHTRRAVGILARRGYITDHGDDTYTLHGPWDGYAGTGNPLPTLSATAAGRAS